MRIVTTHIPPNLTAMEGEWWVEINVQVDDQTYTVLAPIGDGRYWAQQTMEKVVLPALAKRPTDRQPA